MKLNRNRRRPEHDDDDDATNIVGAIVLAVLFYALAVLMFAAF